MDYTFFKSQGVLGFPDNLTFLYGWISPSVIRNMPAKYFAVLSRKGAVGLGYFPEVEWHKHERENILRSVGLKVDYGDQIEYGQSRGLYKTVSDQEHLDMINAYFDGVSMGKIAEKLNRSAATVHAQVHTHDKSIEKVGYCVECRRLKAKHETGKTKNRVI
jgi:hypothetical protein